MATSQVSFRETQQSYGSSSTKTRIGEAQDEMRDWEIGSKNSNDRGWPLRNSFQTGRAGKVADAYGEEPATSSSPRDDDGQVMTRMEDGLAEKQGAEKRGSLKRAVESATDLVANINSDRAAQDTDDGGSVQSSQPGCWCNMNSFPSRVLLITGDGGGLSKQSVDRIRALEKVIISPTTPRGIPLLQRVLQLEHKMTMLEERYNLRALAAQLHEPVSPSLVLASLDTPSSLGQRCLSARSALMETQAKGTLVERIQMLEKRLDEHIGTLEKAVSNGWFTRFDPNHLELDHNPEEAAKLLGWNSNNGDHQDHGERASDAGAIERNHQGEFRESMEPHPATADSAVDNKNLEQNNYKTSSMSEVPQKMKILEKKPTKTSTPEVVKDLEPTHGQIHTWHKVKEKAGGPPQGTAGLGNNGDKSPLAKKDKKKLSKLAGMSFKTVRDKFQRTFTLKQH